MEKAQLLSSSSDRPSSSPFEVSSSTSPDLVPNHDCSRKHDVFLNFRGEDTRKNFMGHLRVALSEKGIETFIDDDQIERGHFISPQLLQAIENSSCAVVILSPNYAFSTWCLDELVKILDCMKTKGQTVIPIFYHVDPSDVRKQTGTFGEAIAKHEMCLNDDLERVNNWKIALAELTNLAGLDLKNYRDEANFVREIVEEVSRKLSSMASLKIVQDKNSLVGALVSSTFAVVKPILIALFFFLIIGPLFWLFFFKVLVPIFLLIIGDDEPYHFP